VCENLNLQIILTCSSSFAGNQASQFEMEQI